MMAGRSLSVIDPGALGIQASTLADISPQDVSQAAGDCERILAGEGTGPQHDIVALNAGVILATLGAAASASEGLERARQILRDKEGLRKLQQLRERVWKHA